MNAKSPGSPEADPTTTKMFSLALNFILDLGNSCWKQKKCNLLASGAFNHISYRAYTEYTMWWGHMVYSVWAPGILCFVLVCVYLCESLSGNMHLDAPTFKVRPSLLPDQVFVLKRCPVSRSRYMLHRPKLIKFNQITTQQTQSQSGTIVALKQ